MSLDITFTAVRPTVVFDINITHNLNKMADAAGIYEVLWRPEEIGITKAEQMIKPLKAGLVKLHANPEYFRQFDASNRWGTYEDFVPFVEEVLAAAIANPDADVSVSR